MSNVIDREELARWRAEMVAETSSRNILDSPAWGVVEKIIAILEPMLSAAPWWLRFAAKLFSPLRTFLAQVMALIEAVKQQEPAE